MIDGTPVVDAHVHVARIPTLTMSWEAWTTGFRDLIPFETLYDADGTAIPEAVDLYCEREGVDVALLMCEYSPRVTGIQPVEDMLPLCGYNPDRFRFIAAVNPHLHHPLAREVERQLDLGAAALKLHPVHGGYPPTMAVLYRAYHVCEERGVPVVFHCGTSVYPGATNRFADPALIDEVARDFPDLKIVLAHGGRGWWYDAAAFLALARPNVWIEISGLPPHRLPHYYARFDFPRLARKMIFGTDWPGSPGMRANVERVRKLDLDTGTVERILWRNAAKVYRGLPAPWSR